ncbi:hypothetical protein IC617_08275 [Neiella sp. HB171785]|uniref:Uncharacterized protein n=1 Tax=Neiella litorisoli TaxID=2771431 RepID=A0A8J6QH27_9GAMM|nr:hypothetical protein [Neiella litorisoli]MBD1389420.1 hypothetical protein [Neiella litorisoli]
MIQLAGEIGKPMRKARDRHYALLPHALVLAEEIVDDLTSNRGFEVHDEIDDPAAIIEFEWLNRLDWHLRSKPPSNQTQFHRFDLPVGHRVMVGVGFQRTNAVDWWMEHADIGYPPEPLAAAVRALAGQLNIRDLALEGIWDGTQLQVFDVAWYNGQPMKQGASLRMQLLDSLRIEEHGLGRLKPSQSAESSSSIALWLPEAYKTSADGPNPILLVSPSEIHVLQATSVPGSTMMAFSTFDQFGQIVDLGHWPQFNGAIKSCMEYIKVIGSPLTGQFKVIKRHEPRQAIQIYVEDACPPQRKEVKVPNDWGDL